MRAGAILAGALLALAALPATGLAGTPGKWPSAAEVRAITPGLAAKDAACIARYYHGRLARTAWLTTYYKLTRAQKIVTDAGFTRCMTLARRAALTEHEDALSFGKHPAELRCSAHREAARSEAVLLSITSLAEAIRAGDRIYRACGVTGALYAALGKSSLIELTPSERACTNRIGSVDPLRHRGTAPTSAQRRAVGAVFDRCVGQATKRAFLARFFEGYEPSKAIPCVVKRAMTIAFVTFYSDRDRVELQAKAAEAACRLAPGSR